MRSQIAYCLKSPFYGVLEPQAWIWRRSRIVDDLASCLCRDTDIHRQSQERSLEHYGTPFSEFLWADPEEIRGAELHLGTTGSPTFYPYQARR